LRLWNLLSTAAELPGSSPTVREGFRTVSEEPFLTVGLLPVGYLQ